MVAVLFSTAGVSNSFSGDGTSWKSSPGHRLLVELASCCFWTCLLWFLWECKWFIDWAGKVCWELTMASKHLLCRTSFFFFKLGIKSVRKKVLFILKYWQMVSTSVCHVSLSSISVGTRPTLNSKMAQSELLLSTFYSWVVWRNNFISVALNTKIQDPCKHPGFHIHNSHRSRPVIASFHR